MRRAAWLAFVLTPLPAAAAQEPAPADEPTIMIVEFPRGARVIGLPAVCPGAPAEADPDERTICLAELYEGRTTVIRHLSGPRVGRGQRLRLTAHARNWRPGTRMLVATRPFHDRGTRGNFAFWWHLPEANEDYCLGVDDVASWGNNPVTRQFLRGRQRRFRAYGYRERADFRCIGT